MIKVRALTSFCGEISMGETEERELVDESAKALSKAGLVEIIAEEKKQPLKRGVKNENKRANS